ncbi:MAG: fibronectin type III domain-containing protein [Clostridium sp.]
MFKNLKNYIAMLVCVLMVGTLIPVNEIVVKAATGVTYYVDSVNGSDENSGTNEKKSWRTLSKVNETEFKPGDKILFKSGSVWNNEQLKPKGSGVDGQPIIIDKYGEGNDPLINTNAKYDYALHLFNQEYFEINNLEITNLGESEKEGRTGVVIEASDIGVLNHVYLKNINVHDVNGNSTRKDLHNGGIYYAVSGSIAPSKFNDILVEGCTVKNVNRGAISVGGGKWDYKFDGYGGRFPQNVIDNYMHTNVAIRNNYIEAAGGDAIVMQFGVNPVIEYNVANGCNTTSNANGQYSAGIWPWRCIDAVFQFNEVYGTKYNGDGMAYDCDFSVGTVYQYNYSHDNEGGFMLMCQNESLDSIVRYNISQNDKVGIFSTSGVASGDVYNNTIYIGEGLNTTPFRFDWGTGKVNMNNNLFYNEGTAKSSRWLYTVNYSNNAYYGYEESSLPNDPNKIIADPMVVAPGTGGYGIDSLDGYRLEDNSPLIDAGMEIDNNGGRDYFGNKVSDGKTDIGSFEANEEVEVEIIVSKVNNLKEVDRTVSSVKLGWESPDNVAGLVEYVIYKDGKKLTSVSSDESEYVVNELRSNTIYGFKVTAKYSNGKESKPQSVNVRTTK